MSKSLGQHFLKNKAAVQKIIAALDMQTSETIVEIGPGHGALTIPLAEAADKIGAKIIAIEKDAALAEILESRLAGTDDKKNSETIEVVTGDALDFLKTPRDGSRGVARADKIVGNIPYYITGHLLRAISELPEKPKLAVLMLQKEVAERICAVPPNMNRLAASVQYWAEPKIIAGLSKTDFSPAPAVDSAVIKFQTRKEEVHGQKNSTKNDQQYYAAVRALFAQPRKTILNNLAAGDSSTVHPPTKNEITTALSKLGIDPKARPQNLTVENISQIAESFF